MHSDPKANKPRPRSWPMWLFVAVSLLLNVSGPSLIEWMDFRSFDRQIQAALFFAGVVSGECCFVLLVAGLTKRTWLGAYLFGLGLAAAGYLAVIAGFWMIGEFDRGVNASLTLLPAFLFIAASPLYGLRHFFGWRLSVDGETPPARQPLQLADIFSLIAIVAALLVLVRVPQVVMESSARVYWRPVVIVGLILFGCGLVILPLYARVACGNLLIPAKLMRLLLLAVLLAFSLFGIIQFFGYSFDTSWSTRLEFLPYLFTFLGAAIAMFYLSLLLLSASGMRLTRGYDSNREQTEDAQRHAAHLKRLTWWRIGGAIAVTMATSIYLANLQQWRTVRDKENTILTRRARATGGSLGVNERIPSYLKLILDRTLTDDEGIAALMSINAVDELSLAHTKITDACLPQLAQVAIDQLDIRGTQITFSGLVNKAPPRLKRLRVASDQFTPQQIAKLKQLGIKVTFGKP